VVLVTHEPEAAAVADRILRLDAGRLAPGLGSAHELPLRESA
jgi:ABC-type lipoprotein export system ATPase subunit